MLTPQHCAVKGRSSHTAPQLPAVSACTIKPQLCLSFSASFPPRITVCGAMGVGSTALLCHPQPEPHSALQAHWWSWEEGCGCAGARHKAAETSGTAHLLHSCSPAAGPRDLPQSPHAAPQVRTPLCSAVSSKTCQCWSKGGSPFLASQVRMESSSWEHTGVHSTHMGMEQHGAERPPRCLWAAQKT